MPSETTQLPEKLSARNDRSLTSTFLKAVRLYTYNTPISKGKYRLYQLALRLVAEKPTAIPARARDGRRFVADLTTGMEESVFFLGVYERFISDIAERLIREGDVCLDVGANFGWYSTMMAARAGSRGEVHSFEPVPRTYSLLEKNCSLLTDAAPVVTNNLALGDRDDVLTINLFDDLPSGHASLASSAGESSSSFECKMTTLDNYLEERGVGSVSFVKVDIEGAEMMFLKGAERLFTQPDKPIFLMEMALAQTRRFGYQPQELLKFIAERGPYTFYRVEETKERLRPIDHFDDDDIGANVFCIPDSAGEWAKAVISDYLERI